MKLALDGVGREANYWGSITVRERGRARQLTLAQLQWGKGYGRTAFCDSMGDGEGKSDYILQTVAAPRLPLFIG